MLNQHINDLILCIYFSENYDPDKMVAETMLHRFSDSMLINDSYKLKFLIQLLHNLHSESHRCLVFSKYRTMLDIIEVSTSTFYVLV